MEKNEYLSSYERIPLPGANEVRNQVRITQKIQHLQLRVDIILAEIERNNIFIKKYTFIVFENKTNRVAHTRDNTIFIPTGLIHITKNEHELAFIIAHEIAHWENEDIKNNSAPEWVPPGLIIDGECNADKKGLNLLEKTRFKKDLILKFIKRMQSIRPTCPEHEEE